MRNTVARLRQAEALIGQGKSVPEIGEEQRKQLVAFCRTRTFTSPLLRACGLLTAYKKRVATYQ